MSMLRVWLRRLLLVAGSLAVALLLGEIALRLFMPQPIGFDAGRIWEPADGLRWRRRANLDVRVNTGEREVRLLSDAARHRVGTTSAGPAAIRILVMGDSMIEALQVDAEQTMASLLARSLSTRLGRTVDVVNAGVGGWDPNQYLTATRQELEQSSYDLALIFVYLDNDIVSRRASYPAATNLELPAFRPFADGAARTLQILGLHVQAALSQHSHLFVYSRNLIELRRIRAGSRSHLLTNAMRSNRVGPAWAITADILNDIAVEGRRFHVPVAFVLLPPAHYIDLRFLAKLEWALGVSPDDVDIHQAANRLGDELKQRGLDVIDPAPALQQAFDNGEINLYGHIDTHLAPAGHQVMARFLEPIALRHLAAAEVTH
jgi:hypothetical protein